MICVINKIVSPGIFIVKDSLDRSYRVSGNSTYKVGTAVIVIDSIIVGESTRRESTRVYNV